MSSSLAQEFGPWRALLWPIHRYELRKLLPMLLMIFLMCFCYSILRNLKDALIVTASGAEVLPFIKVWVLLPTAIALTYLFTRLSSTYSQERVFYIMISLFLGFFALFAFIIYPNKECLHPTAYASTLQKILPVGFKGLIAMFCNWSYTCFYVVSELWSTAIMGVLFWGFANEVTSVKEAKRFYGVLGTGASFAAVVAGQLANCLSFDRYYPNIPYGNDAWEQTQITLLSVIILAGLMTMLIFRWMNKNVLTDSCYDTFHLSKKALKTKKRLSLRESFHYLSNSTYLICIAVLVIGYNLVIHMTEVVWKDQLSQMHPSAVDYNFYMNNLTSVVGIFATLTALVMAKIIEKLGWTRTALITPALMAFTCLGVFSVLFLKDSYADAFYALFGLTPLGIAVFFGAAQNCLSKAAKYSVFDTTKEMAFIPLDHETKLRGKAAIDGVGSRLGKSGGAIIHQGLLMCFGTIGASAPYVAIIVLGMIVIWVLAVRTLGKQFAALVAENAQPAIQTQEWETSPSKA